MDFVKSIFVGLGAVVLFCWAVYAVVWGLVFLFSAGDTWGQTWMWLNIVALVPYGAAVLVILAGIGETVRKGDK